MTLRRGLVSQQLKPLTSSRDKRWPRRRGRAAGLDSCLDVMRTFETVGNLWWRMFLSRTQPLTFSERRSGCWCFSWKNHIVRSEETCRKMPPSIHTRRMQISLLNRMYPVQRPLGNCVTFHFTGATLTNPRRPCTGEGITDTGSCHLSVNAYVHPGQWGHYRTVNWTISRKWQEESRQKLCSMVPSSVWCGRPRTSSTPHTALPCCWGSLDNNYLLYLH